jgi:4-phosphopantoate--beta-alanine ligase
MKRGLVHETGLIAHGRGEAFDYLLGELTIPFSVEAEKVSAASLLLAKKPVISLNGNVVSLVPKDCIRLASAIPANLEVNLFHRTNDRVEKLIREMESFGGKNILGATADARIPGLDHDRGICEKKGIYSSDVILVPLEDGDRCEALKKMGKQVIVIDLNPLSRSARMGDITIVDNVIRAIPAIEHWVTILKEEDEQSLKELVSSWDNEEYLKQIRSYISKRLNSTNL